MHLQKTRKEGSSCVVVIPHVYCRELDIAPGDYVSMRTDHDGHVILGKVQDYVDHANRTPPHPRRPGR